jgi:hypothetical protein
MTPPLRGLIAASVMIVALASACSPDSTASPPPPPRVTTTTTTTSTTTSSDPPRPTKPPPVTRAFDITRYREHPCDLLTREQQTTLGLPGPENSFELCQWKRSEPKVSVNLNLVIDLNYMLQVYLQSNQTNSTFDRKEWVVFDPITVGGQPAVLLNSTTQQTAMGILVATSPDDCIDITVTIETGADPRAMAVAIAEQVVGNLAK